MSDKEFDQLFNAKLADLEIEPSAELWGKIVPEIPGGKGKSGLAPMMSIAATLVILLTAGLLFMPRTQKLALHGKYDPQQTINEPVAAVTQQPSVAEDMLDVAPEQQRVAEHPQTLAVVKHPTVSKVGNKVVDPVISNPVDTMQNIAHVKPMTIVKPDHQDNPVIKASIPTNTIANVAPKADQLINPAKAIAMNPQETKSQEAVKKKKIHSLGDLLNVVIAKVDKRDKKIIQFASSSDDDDDDLLNVTGINLGPIKVKKQN